MPIRASGSPGTTPRMPMLLAIVAAIGLAGIFAVMSYRIFNFSEATASLLFLGLGIVAIGAGLIYVMSRAPLRRTEFVNG